MDQFPSNSDAARKSNAAQPANNPVENLVEPADVVVHKVVTGKVTRRKKSMLYRVSETLFHGESSVFGYLLQEVLVPTLKYLVTTMAAQGLEKALYGEVRSPRGTGIRGASRVGHQTHTPYDRYAGVRPTPTTTMGPTARRPMQRPATNVSDIVVDTKAEAQDIIDQLFGICEQYGMATVGQLKHLIGETPVHTDHNYGWTDLTQMTAKRVPGGFLLIFPSVEILS